MDDAEAEARAATLGSAMLIFGLVREPAREALDALEDVPLLTAEEWEAWREGDDEDLRITRACLDAEYELRANQWIALDMLGVALSPPSPAERGYDPAGAAEQPDGAPQGLPPGRVWVERRELAALASAILGWDTTAPEEG